MAINYIDSIEPKQATGKVKQIYSDLKIEMGDVVEPISLHSLIPDLLHCNWNVLREALVVSDKVERKYKEAVASAVSSMNDCPYCVDAHTIMMIGLNDRQTAKAIASQDMSLVTDPKSKELLNWAYRTKFFISDEVRNPPFSKDEAPEIIGTAVFFHYLNRMVTVFLGETILPLNIGFLKGLLKNIAAMMFSKVLNTEKEANYQNIEYDDIQEFGEDFFWASENIRIRSSLSSFYRTVHYLGKESIPEAVYYFMENEIEDWTGSEFIEMKELKEKIGRLEKKYELMATALYYVAFMPYRISEDMLANLKREYTLQDDQILAMFSWTAYRTATKIGTKLGHKFK